MPYPFVKWHVRERERVCVCVWKWFCENGAGLGTLRTNMYACAYELNAEPAVLPYLALALSLERTVRPRIRSCIRTNKQDDNRVTLITLFGSIMDRRQD